MKKEEDKNKRNGIIVSATVHAILLVLFAFFGMTYQDPPPEKPGIAINFGTSDQGMVSEAVDTPVEAVENTPTNTELTEPTPTETVEEDILTQSNEDAPAIDKKEKKKEKVEPVEKKEEPKPNTQLLNALDKLKNKNTEQGGSSDGETNQPGDQGNINGDPDSKNYKGNGLGTDGIAFDLSGRSIKSVPKIQDNSQDQGTVVVDIIVDKYGKVLRATPGARGSTTTSAKLYKTAREAALDITFDVNPDASEEQKGTVTFTFILN